MQSNNKPTWIKTVGLRMIIVSAMIALLTMFWVYLVFFTNLPMLALAGIALLILLTLSTATAWTAIGVPRRESDADDSQRDD